jgi:hypothetical protein
MDHPVNGFGIDYGDELVYCEAVMHDNHYEILFNGKWIASIELTDDENWILASGTILPQAVIDEIGRKIEEQYD